MNARRRCSGASGLALWGRCGRGSAGRASPCQGEGRGFESRRPLGGAGRRPASRRSARLFGTRAGSPGARCGGMAEWLRQGPAKPCTRVRFPLPPRAVSSVGERFPDTEEVTSSNLVPPTSSRRSRPFSARSERPAPFEGEPFGSRAGSSGHGCTPWPEPGLHLLRPHGAQAPWVLSKSVRTPRSARHDAHSLMVRLAGRGLAVRTRRARQPGLRGRVVG
jgi:hypothetical protein